MHPPETLREEHLPLHIPIHGTPGSVLPYDMRTSIKIQYTPFTGEQYQVTHKEARHPQGWESVEQLLRINEVISFSLLDLLLSLHEKCNTSSMD